MDPYLVLSLEFRVSLSAFDGLLTHARCEIVWVSLGSVATDYVQYYIVGREQ